MKRIWKSIVSAFAKFTPASPARNPGRRARLGLESLEGREVPSAVPNFAGETFALQYDNAAASQGLLKITAENTTTGAFTGVYTNQATGGVASVQGIVGAAHAGAFGHSVSSLFFYGSGNEVAQFTGQVTHVGTGRDVLGGSVFEMALSGLPRSSTASVTGYDYFPGADLTGRTFSLHTASFGDWQLLITSVDVQGNFQGVFSSSKVKDPHNGVAVTGTLRLSGWPGEEYLSFTDSRGDVVFKGAVHQGRSASWGADDLTINGGLSILGSQTQYASGREFTGPNAGLIHHLQPPANYLPR